MTDKPDIDAIEAAPMYYQEGSESTVVALCQEVRRLRAVEAEYDIASMAVRSFGMTNHDTALHRLRGAQRLLAIAVDHVERAHAGDAYKQRGVREQATSAIAMAAGQIAEAGALFMIEVLRDGMITDEPAQPGCGVAVEDGTPCGTDRGKSIALCDACFDVALDRAGWKGPR